MTVRRLDDRTVERIAAGEVVTRPVDVVVELVENALDAGASRVDVTVDGDGTDRIRVADDGTGIDADDAALAVHHHTTSKLDPGGDLRRVDTLGFRGEALASIAAAGRLELVTNDGGPRGTRVVVEDDGPRTEPAGRAVGTTVEVTDLFFDRPARRKSLASPKAEFARVSDVVTRYALTRPDVRFRLTHDGNETLSTPGAGPSAFTDALLAVYDRETAGSATAFETETTLGVDGDDREATADGALCAPGVTRASTEAIHVAVDGRPLRDAMVRQAVLEGYGDLLPGGRYPVAVVRVSLPPGFVDANVHPAKREVAYRDADAVAGLVSSAVRDALSTADLRRSADVAMDLDSSLRPVETDSAFADATVIGQYRGLYLLCEADDDLLVVDQHAAHERVNFERLRAAVADEEVATRPVDPPATLALSPAEAALVEAHADRLAALGFDVDPFGGSTVRVAGVPAPLGRPADPEALCDVLAGLEAAPAGRADGGDAPGSVAAREDLLCDLACHPSLKAGEDLSAETAATLVARLGQCEQPYTCPHGRPTVLSIEESALARGFGRTATRFD